MDTNREIHNRQSVFNTATPAANVDLLTTAISLSAAGKPYKYIRVYACFSNAGKLTALITRSAATVTLTMNQDTDLTAGAAYIFDVPISYGDTVNFRYSAAAGTTYLFNADTYSG